LLHQYNNKHTTKGSLFRSSLIYKDGTLYLYRIAKLAEINALVIAPRKLTTLLSITDIPFTRIMGLLQCITLFSRHFLQLKHLYFA